MHLLSCAHPTVHKNSLYTHSLVATMRISGTEEGYGRAGLWDSLGLDVYQCLGETEGWSWKTPEPAGVLPTCFLTPILLPVNSAALQPEWPGRTLWVLLSFCFVLHQAGSPALHSCSLPVAASYTQAQSWAVSKRTRNVLSRVTTLESSKVGPLGKGRA